MVIRTDASVNRDALNHLVGELASKNDRLEIWTINPTGGGNFKRVR